ncbi:MAG: T9SS type A sorting domain-containing protein, partial [Ignavibacteriaceae bacterium]
EGQRERFISLKVYDILGREVATLVNEEKPAGEYEVEFSATGGATNLTSGIYFYQLRAGGFVDTKKLILIK